jgi:hypothetical protein
MSILRNLVAEVRPDPAEGKTLEQFALELALAGTSQPQAVQLLARAAKKMEARRAAEWQERDRIRKAAEARQMRIDGAASVVARFWAVLGWNEGSPDDSGPVFPTQGTPIRFERQRSPLDID